MKRKWAIWMAATLAAVSVLGCGSEKTDRTESKGGEETASESGKENGITSGETIEYAVNYQQDAQAEVMQEICDDFEKKTGIHVELTLSGADHESVMKTRMASGSLEHPWMVCAAVQ